MPGAVLHASGSLLVPKSLLRGTNLTPYQQHEAGDLRTVGPHKGQPFGHGGFSLLVSDIDGDLSAQKRDAIAFLNSHRESLAKTLCCATVEDSRIDFGYDLRIGDKTVFQCDYLPPELLRLVGEFNIGIELSLYPTQDGE